MGGRAIAREESNTGVEPPSEYSTSEIEIRHPYRGWEFAGHFQHTMKARQPIAEIEHLSKGEMLTLALEKNLPVRDQLGTGMGSDWPQRVTIDAGQYKHIMEAITNELLQWTIELEKRGIKGEDMDFNENEKQSATHQVFNIQKFTGVLGDVTNSQVTLYDYSSIHQLLKERNVPQDQRNELENILDDLRSAPPEKKKSLIERGKAWISRNKEFLGSTAEIVGKVIGASMK